MVHENKLYLAAWRDGKEWRVHWRGQCIASGPDPAAAAVAAKMHMFNTYNWGTYVIIYGDTYQRIERGFIRRLYDVKEEDKLPWVRFQKT